MTTTMRDARASYFEANDFGADGGYGDAWVDFKLGPIPFPFPNTPSRIRAVGYHDLHHVLTGYATDFVGELEISAWEIGAGCKGFAAAWALNLGGMGGGLFRAPRRSFAAFVRGRRSRTLYGEEMNAVLDRSVDDVRAERIGEGTASIADVLLFALASAAGLAVATLLFAIVLPLVPVGLVMTAIRRGQLARAAARNGLDDARSRSAVGSGSSSSTARL